LAEAYIKFGKKAQAEEALKKAMKINSEYTQARDMMTRYFKK
jgi:Tfp pilus assembly protein PilF